MLKIVWLNSRKTIKNGRNNAKIIDLIFNAVLHQLHYIRNYSSEAHHNECIPILKRNKILLEVFFNINLFFALTNSGVSLKLERATVPIKAIPAPKRKAYLQLNPSLTVIRPTSKAAKVPKADITLINATGA